MENTNERIERLLALLLLKFMKDDGQINKIKALNIVGFTNSEIAELLGSTPGVIASYIYQSKKRKK